MNKIYGNIEDFTLVKDERSRVVVSYGMVAEEDNVHATWYEVYLCKSQTGIPDLRAVRQAVEDDIDKQTDAKILNTFPWTILHGDNEKPIDQRDIGREITVWLSRENQDNFKEAHRLACIDATKVVPIRFKLNEEEDKSAIYDTFETFEELNDFYLRAFNYIKVDCIDAGWARKDFIDWQPYEEALANLPDDNEPQAENNGE